MKRTSMLLCLCLATLAAIGFSVAAYAGGEVGAGCTSAFILPDKSAPGQQLQGTMTIFFTEPGSIDGELNDAATWWFMRIVKGNTVYAFDGQIIASLDDPPYYIQCPGGSPYYDPNSIQYKLLQSMQDASVIQRLGLGYGPTATFALQNYSNRIQSPDGTFVTFDFVIAVQK